MFTNVGWGEILVIGVIALVVLGPERLPEAARWLAGTMRKVKEFAGTAQQQLKDDFGTDFDDFREPLAQLNELRGMGPRALVTKHLLDGDDSLLTGSFDRAAPVGGVQQASPTPQTKADIYRASAAERAGSTAVSPADAAPTRALRVQTPQPHAPQPHSAGGAVWDADAT